MNTTLLDVNLKLSITIISQLSDTGMYLGGRAYLEITAEGRIIAHDKRRPQQIKADMIAAENGAWAMRDLTRELCDM